MSVHPPVQLEQRWHRALAGVLALGFAGLALVPVGALVWLGVRMDVPDELMAGLAVLAVPMSAGLGWVALLGMRDLLVGYELRFDGGRMSWPHHLWRTSVPLDGLVDVEVDARTGDVAVMLADGRRILLGGTRVLPESDRLAALEAIRVMIPPGAGPSAG